MDRDQSSESVLSRDDLYAVMRAEALSAPQEGAVLSIRQICERWGCSGQFARDVVAALVVDGYYTIEGRAFRPAAWQSGLSDEAFVLAEALIFNALASYWLSGTSVEELERLERARRDKPNSEVGLEQTLWFFNELMGGARRDSLADLCAEVVPAAMFRIIWIVDETDMVGQFMRDIIDAIAHGSADLLVAVNERFWALARAAIVDFNRQLIAGASGGQKLHSLGTGRDIAVSGLASTFGRRVLAGGSGKA